MTEWRAFAADAKCVPVELDYAREKKHNGVVRKADQIDPQLS